MIYLSLLLIQPSPLNSSKSLNHLSLSSPNTSSPHPKHSSHAPTFPLFFIKVIIITTIDRRRYIFRVPQSNQDESFL